MNNRNNSKEKKSDDSIQAMPPRPRHLPTSFYGRIIGTRTRSFESSTITSTRRMSDPAISRDDSAYLTDFFALDSDLARNVSLKEVKESPKSTPSPRSSPSLEINTRKVNGSGSFTSPSSATSLGSSTSSMTSDLSGISTNSSPPISTRINHDSPDNSEDRLDNVPEEISSGVSITPRRADLVTEDDESLENLTVDVQNEILERVLKSTLIVNDDSPQETATKKIIMDHISDVWEENLEILSLTSMALATDRSVGIYSYKGINSLKTVAASAEALIGEMGFAPERVGILNTQLKDQSAPIVWLDDLIHAKKPFNLKKSIVFIPLHYNFSDKRITQEAFESAVLYFSRSKMCEVIVYMANEQVLPEVSTSRVEWLSAKQKFVEGLSKSNVRFMGFAELAKTASYIDAQTIFLNRLILLSSVNQKLYEDVIARFNSKNTPSAFHNSEVEPETPVEEEKENSIEVVKSEEELAIEKLTTEKQNEAQNKILTDKRGMFLIQDNPDPSEETIKNVMTGYSTHIWEENLEILALAAMAEASGRPVGIYYKKGIKDIRTVVATGEAADGEAGFAAGRVATLNGDLNDQNSPVVWYNNLTGARKVFDFKKEKPIIFIPICYTSAPGHRLENKEFESVVNYYARSRNCEVIVYLGRDAGLSENIVKRQEWLKPHNKYLTSMLKYAVTIMHRAQFVKTTFYLQAEKLFLYKLINRDKVSQKFYEDIILRLEQKKQLPTKRHISPSLSSMVPDKRKMSPQKIKTAEMAPEIKSDDIELPTQASPSPKGFIFTPEDFFSEIKSAKTDDEVHNLTLFARLFSSGARGGKARGGVSRNLASQFMSSQTQAATESNHVGAQTEPNNTSPRPR